MNTDKNLDNEDFKHRELTRDILNAAFKVHNTLGCGFLEKVYENALVYELKQRRHRVDVQKAIKIRYGGEIVGEYIADIMVEDKVIVEIKAVEQTSVVHKAQVLNYLKATGCEIGLILNFAKPKLEYYRLAMGKLKYKHR